MCTEYMTGRPQGSFVLGPPEVADMSQKCKQALGMNGDGACPTALFWCIKLGLVVLGINNGKLCAASYQDIGIHRVSVFRLNRRHKEHEGCAGCSIPQV